MKLITRLLYLPVVGILLLGSCAKEESESYDKFEDQALEAWMTQNRPELLGNLQSDGHYYVEVLDVGEALTDVKPLRDTACWVRFDFSGRDLSGNIILTRRAAEAKLVNTFSKYTHYVPYYRYCGVVNTNLMEGTYLAMRNVLQLGEKYVEDNKALVPGLTTELELRKGSKIRLYMPSRIVGSSGVEGEGGYEGQYSPSSQRPFIVVLEIKNIVKNPLESEGSEVHSFCGANGGLWLYTEEGDEPGSSKIPTSYDDEHHPYKLREDGYRWVSVCDTVAQVYVDLCYDPMQASENLNFDFAVKDEEDAYLWQNRPYNVGFAPYDGSDLETKIAEVLKERFHADEEYTHPGVGHPEADSVGLNGEAKIWYIGRFLDGFIFDTNIDEVKELIYGEISSEGSALTYTPEEDRSSLISSYYYVIPNLCYGQWAEFVTISSQAYGATGRTGSTTTSGGSSGYSSSYFDYLNYYNYLNSYYGNSYYGSYYGNYYYDYYNSYYYNYGYGYDDSTTETTTTISTEIPPYTPLIFQIYIEPADE